MAAEPVEEAADPAREAEKAPPTVLHGTLTVEVPGGETMVLKTTFDSGSNTDAVSEKVAIYNLRSWECLGVKLAEVSAWQSVAVWLCPMASSGCCYRQNQVGVMAERMSLQSLDHSSSSQMLSS